MSGSDGQYLSIWFSFSGKKGFRRFGSRYLVQSMEWIELERSSPVQIHQPLILIQSNPAGDPESESSPVQSGHNSGYLPNTL